MIERDAVDAIEGAAETIDDLPKFHYVYCEQCEWGVRVWTRGEAELRGKVHSQMHDKHTVLVEPVMLMDQRPTELGFPED